MRIAVIGVLAVGLVGCGTEPSASIAFKPDAATCTGSAAVDLFVDGSKVGSPTLSAGTASDPFPVAEGEHVVSAKSLASGVEWPNAQVTVNGPTVYVLACSASRPLVPFTGSIANRLAADIVIVSGTVTDTIAAGVTETRNFVGTGGFSWSPVPVRYSDGTKIPDDNLFGGANMTAGGTREIVAEDDLGTSYFTFSLTNTSGVAFSLGVFSGISLRCIASIPAASAAHRFGFYQLQPGTEVRAYRGPSCSDNYVLWSMSVLTQRDPKSGFIPLAITTPP